MLGIIETNIHIVRLALDELRYWGARADRPATPEDIKKAPLIRADVWVPHATPRDIQAIGLFRTIWAKLDEAGRDLLVYGLRHVDQGGGVIIARRGERFAIALQPASEGSDG